MEAAGTGGRGDGVTALGAELDGRGLERGGGGPSRSQQCWTSQGVSPPLTGCPLSVGKSRRSILSCKFVVLMLSAQITGQDGWSGAEVAYFSISKLIVLYLSSTVAFNLVVCGDA